MKEDENAFFRTFEPVGVNKQHTAINKNDAGPWILVKNLSEKRLESLADGYALTTIDQFKQNGNKAIYTIVGLLYYGRAYDSLALDVMLFGILGCNCPESISD